MPQQTEAQRQATFQAAGQQPVAQAPTTPVPQIASPAASQVNPNAAFQTPGTMSGVLPQTTVNVNTSPQPATQTGAQPAAKPALAMPTNGSVVDLLNSAGQDSSYAARQQLAQQYGIQGYTGTAAQNTDLSKKYLEAYNTNKATKAPESGAQASSALDTYFKDTPQAQTSQDPIKQFMDSFASQNPIEANIFQQLSTLASTPFNQQLSTDLFKQEFAAQGLPELNMEFADMKRIMEGTEDDIRDEVRNAGGFATESQVQALSAGRNKVLLKKANYLADIINAKSDYVDHVVSLTQADRKQVSDDLDRKLGITKTLFDMSQQMTNNAKENMQSLVSNVGYNGLAKMLQNDPSQRTQAEKVLGLPNGALSNPAFLQAAAPAQKLTTQIVEVSGRKALVTFDGSGNPTNLVDLGAADVPGSGGSGGSGGLTSGQVNAFNSIVSKYNSSPLVQASDRTAVLTGTIKKVRENPSDGSQQLNLAYSYVQALDTYQSAVREGELGLVNSIDSKIGQLNNSVQQIQNGQIVRPEVALQIANAAESIVNTINSAAKQKAQSFSSQANVVGLGQYWNQYVSGFNQGYNQPITTNAKGSSTNAQFVEKTLVSKGLHYQKVLEDTPMGQIPVLMNDTGEVGSIPESEFDPSTYTRI